MIWIGIAQGLVAAIVYFFSVLVSLRALRRRDPMFIVLEVAAAAYVVVFAALVLLGQAVNFWVFSTSYWFFVLCFLMAFGATYKSLSLQILLQLSKKPDRSELVELLREQYVFGKSFRDRLDLIVELGLANKNENRLRLTPSGKMLAGCVRAVQRAFGIMRSG